MKSRPSSTNPVVGWREWVSLPDLRIDRIKAKIDTGARSSSIHAYDIQTFEKEGHLWVRFSLHPLQRNDQVIVQCEATLLGMRSVRSSNGFVSQRPVICTTLELGGESWPIELNLATRDQMGFRLLLGREALRHRVSIDPGRSFVASRGKGVRTHRFPKPESRPPQT